MAGSAMSTGSTGITRPNRSSRGLAKTGRRRKPAIPSVPTFQPDTAPLSPRPARIEDDPAEEAVRRMVEAAYT